jgi:hypothetical protein
MTATTLSLNGNLTFENGSDRTISIDDDNTARILTIKGNDEISYGNGNGGNLNLQGGSGYQSAGNVTVKGADSYTGSAGDVTIKGGNDIDSSIPGNINIEAGNSYSNGGSVYINGGYSYNTGGNLNLQGGSGYYVSGGKVYISGGDGIDIISSGLTTNGGSVYIRGGIKAVNGTSNGSVYIGTDTTNAIYLGSSSITTNIGRLNNTYGMTGTTIYSSTSIRAGSSILLNSSTGGMTGTTLSLNGNLTFGNGSDRTITIADEEDIRTLTIKGNYNNDNSGGTLNLQGGGGYYGGTLNLQGGSGYIGGGNVTIRAGEWAHSGINGSIYIGTVSTSAIYLGNAITIPDGGTPGDNQVLYVDTSDNYKLKRATIGGDVWKVSTPVDNQVGVWTGNGTIEGTTGLTFYRDEYSNVLKIDDGGIVVNKSSVPFITLFQNNEETFRIIGYSGTTVDNTDSYFQIKTNDIERFGINNGGATFTVPVSVVSGLTINHGSNTITLTGGTGYAKDWVATSDIRFKENIKPIENALDKVLNSRGVYFNFINDENKEQKIGVIAQELEQTIPQLVINKNGDEIRSVSYGSLSAVLIEAIKEQNIKIKEQDIRIMKLEEYILLLLK